MPLHAELHRHLGGAVAPRIFWRFLHRQNHPLATQFPVYEEFEAFLTQPRASLVEFLELHTMVEQVQTLDNLQYFISKLVRGAYVFEGILYLELRYTPYYRTDTAETQSRRIEQMAQIITTIASAASMPDYPVVLKQILCMHSCLPLEVNKAIVELATMQREHVCGVDLAGPDFLYRNRLSELVGLFEVARENGLKTTCHLFETSNGFYPEFLPYLNRIGHGIQVALERPDLLVEIAKRQQCLEVCPTSYLKTGTLPDLTSLRQVFHNCERAGVDIAICTDNPGLHNVRLPFEFENLLSLDIIDFEQLKRCQVAAYRHAFAWPHNEPPDSIVRDIINKQAGTMTGPDEKPKSSCHLQ